MKSKSEKDYIEQIVPFAQEAQRKFKYLASVLIAQACQENGYGLDNDCLVLMDANNILGMKRELLNDTWKSDYWDGSYIVKPTPEWYGGKLTYINDAFRKYASIRDCIMDYCQFMRDAKRDDGSYKYRDVLGIKDPGELIKQVRTRGYCTDPTYDYSIVKIIAKHNLTQYDLKDIKEDKPMHEIIDITAENHAPRTRTLPIKYIVMHYLGVPNADNPYLYNGGYGGHYNVTRAGKIYKAVDPRKGVVWHCGGGLQGNGGHTFYGKCTNYNSIGIECGVCADTDAKDLSGDSYLWYFTEETQEAAAWLVAQLMKEYDIDIDHVIRHYDVTGKCCPNPYVLDNRRKTSWTWEQFKERVKELYSGAESVREDVYMVEFKVIGKGDNNEDVGTAQKLLNADGYTDPNGNPLKVDKDFGDNTAYAVGEFQKNNGLEADKVIGPKTWARLFGK